MMWLVVDRIEGAIAVVEFRGRMYNLGARERGEMRLPKLREGQIYRWTGRGWKRDTAEERRRKRAAAEQYRRMVASDTGGNITL